MRVVSNNLPFIKKIFNAAAQLVDASRMSFFNSSYYENRNHRRMDNQLLVMIPLTAPLIKSNILPFPNSGPISIPYIGLTLLAGATFFAAREINKRNMLEQPLGNILEKISKIDMPTITTVNAFMAAVLAKETLTADHVNSGEYILPAACALAVVAAYPKKKFRELTKS